MSEAIAQVIRTYPGWSLFCGLIVALAVINGTVSIVRGRPAPALPAKKEDAQ